MPKAPATVDVFFAIAEPRRREIIELLGSGQRRPVGELVDCMRLLQPAVSKHLSVLRKVGLVSVEKQGKQRLYRLEAARLRPVHDWVKNFEQYWTHQLDRIKQRAERLARERAAGK
jgi:DNA-binding transcriptional ArsR family regulator